MKTIIFNGMCYSGKSTLGKMTADILGLPFLDSRDLFFKIYGMSEIDYLSKFGREKFIEAEKKSLYHDFEGVFSLGGSAVYYPQEMKMLNEKYEIIWLNVDFDIIESRKRSENKERPIVYPDGIESFKKLYEERKKLYEKYFTHKIDINQKEKIEETINKILSKLDEKLHQKVQNLTG